MVEVVYDVERPMLGWECRYCDEPYNSRSKPDQRVCLACGDETVWELPEEHEEEIRARLNELCVGDELTIVPDHAGAMRGEVTDIVPPEILLDGDTEQARVIDVAYFVMYQPGERVVQNGVPLGDDIHHVITHD